jgi:Na+/citrate or Na+/malate symporter
MSTSQKTQRRKIEKIKILGFPLPLYLVLAALILLVAWTKALPTTMVGALGFALIVGTLMGWIGDRIPIWNDWLGGGMLFTCLATGALVTFKIIPDDVINTISSFNGDMGFLDLYIVVLITGAILNIDRKLLIKAFAGFFPAVLGGIFVSLVFTAGSATLVGMDPLKALTNIFLPIMGGGNGAGCIPMSKIWGSLTGQDPAVWYAPAFAVMSLGNLVCVIFAALLDRLGKKYPKLTGNGKMMEGEGLSLTSDESIKEPIKISIGEYASGLGIGLFLFCLATFYSNNISIVNHANLGFTIHPYAFMVIFAAIFNALGIIPEEIRLGAKGMQQFFTKYMSFPLMVTVGIGTNLGDYVGAFTLQNMVIIIACVIGAVIGAALIGKLFHFYPIEVAITAGLDVAGGGGAGDVQILGACHRMELMSFAQIADRIGGAFMLILASILFGML